MPDEIAHRRRRQRLLTGAALVLVSACAQAPQQPQFAVISASPPLAGQARIWFYRDYEPSVSRNTANVAINGNPAGSVPFYDGILYRDVPPGHYRVSVESYGNDGHQAGEADLAPGQQLFVKVLVSDDWIQSGDLTSFHRDTFDVAFMPPDTARAELANIRP